MTELEAGALAAIRDLLDSGKIPRGTFADDQVRNLVCFFNWQGEALERIAAGHAKPEKVAADVLEKIRKAREP